MPQACASRARVSSDKPISDVPTLLNVYSCGCTALNVPIISQCDEHGGNVVAATRDFVDYHRRKAFQTKDKRSALFYANLMDGIARVRDKSVGLLFSYPDHFHFYARELVTGKAYRDFPDNYFTACKRILTDDAHIALVVEHTVLASVVYCARLSGYKLAGQYLIPMRISDHPIQHDFADKYNCYKAGLVFSRSGSLPDSKVTSLREFERLALSLHNDGFIMDTSCIHYPFMLKARDKARTIGVVSNKTRYAAMKKRLAKKR